MKGIWYHGNCHTAVPKPLTQLEFDWCFVDQANRTVTLESEQGTATNENQHQQNGSAYTVIW